VIPTPDLSNIRSEVSTRPVPTDETVEYRYQQLLRERENENREMQGSSYSREGSYATSFASSSGGFSTASASSGFRPYQGAQFRHQYPPVVDVDINLPPTGQSNHIIDE
jgi:hypothetical protein